MMNNPKAPGKNLGFDFLGPEATNLIPYRDGYQTTYYANVQITAGSPTYITIPGVVLADNSGIMFGTTGSLPSGLDDNTQMFVMNPTGNTTFTVKADRSNNATIINSTGTQFGVHEGRVASSSSPLGQSLGPYMIKADALDVANGRDLYRRSFFSAGEGGQSIYVIEKNAPLYTDNETYSVYDRTIRMFRRDCELINIVHGVGVVCETYLHLQHEEDAGNASVDPDNWKAHTLQLLIDLPNDIVAITGQQEPVEVLFDIGSSVFSRTYANAAFVSDIILKQVELAREDHPHIGTCGVSYYLPRAPSAGALHGSNEGVVVLSEMFAIARDKRYKGIRPDFLYANTFSLSGNTITIDCHNPSTGNLVIDTTVVPEATGTNDMGQKLKYGLEFFDSSNTYITNVSVTNNTITVSLNQTPSSNGTIRGAMSGMGARFYFDEGGIYRKTAPAWTNIRTANATPSTLLTGYNIYEFLAPFKYTF